MTTDYIVLENRQALGDAVVTTGLVRDLYKATRGRVRIAAIAGGCQFAFDNNPYITREIEWDGKEQPPQPTRVKIHYALVKNENRPYHMLHHGAMQIKEQTGIDVPLTRYGGDLHLSDAEKQWPQLLDDAGVPKKYWVMVAGGRQWQTWKWWSDYRWQQVIDLLRGMVTFVLVGDKFTPPGHHARLKGAIDLRGMTKPRDLMRVIYHAEGVVCSVTGPMHIAAALPTKPGGSMRQCVVVAGGVESPQYGCYPQHKVFHTMGLLPCCAEHGCWSFRTVPIGDDNRRDKQLCQYPQFEKGMTIPRCLQLISPESVAQEIVRISGQLANPYAVRV